jgi:hypothetical protein
MSFFVRRVGGGTFNRHTLCFSPNGDLAFVACGPIIKSYRVPDLSPGGQITSHRCAVTAIACTRDYVISGDGCGVIQFHRFVETADFEKAPHREYAHSEPIERLLVRGDALFFVFFRWPHFWVTELDNPSPSS